MNYKMLYPLTQRVIDHGRELVAGLATPDVDTVSYKLVNKFHETHALSYLNEIAEWVCEEQRGIFAKQYKHLSTHKDVYLLENCHTDADDEDDDGTKEVSKEEYDTYDVDETVTKLTVFTNGVNRTIHSKFLY